MHAWCFYDFMYTLKVLFKLNSVPCRASWYMTKKILVNPLACNIFYTKKKKKSYVESFIISISWSWWKWHMVFKEWAELDPLRYKYSGGMRFSSGV